MYREPSLPIAELKKDMRIVKNLGFNMVKIQAVPSWIDWRYFMDDIYLAQAIRWKMEAFKKNDSQKRPVFSHMGAPREYRF